MHDLRTERLVLHPLSVTDSNDLFTARGLLSHAKSMGLQTVTARIHSANRRSELLLSKLGFQLVNEMPRCEIRPGVFRDCLRLLGMKFSGCGRNDSRLPRR